MFLSAEKQFRKVKFNFPDACKFVEGRGPFPCLTPVPPIFPPLATPLVPSLAIPLVLPLVPSLVRSLPITTFFEVFRIPNRIRFKTLL